MTRNSFTSASVGRIWLAAVALLLATGCMRSDAPRFRLNFEGKDRSEVSADQQQALVDALYAMFGTPDEPFVLPESGLDMRKLKMAAGSAARQSGDPLSGRHGLYRQHCAHCHGITGDGAGPTAAFLKPYPRDYRQGKFKFTSTGSSFMPRTADIRKTLVDGINGTAMPSFALLPADEIDALTEYVKYLAIRGQTEFYISDALAGGADLPLGRQTLVDDSLVVAVGTWTEADGDEASVIPPLRFEELADANNDAKVSREELTKWLADNFAKIDKNGDGQIDADEQVQPEVMSDPPISALKDETGKIVKMSGDADGDLKVSQQEFNDFVLGYFDAADANHDAQVNADENLAASILAGRQLFVGAGGCVKCHGPTGLGDNEEAIYDDWNKDKKDKTPAEIAALWSLPRQELKPRNLRLGTYRGGRRPVDLYRRLHAGIKGTPMPALGPSGSNPAKIKSEDVWHLVDFVRSLPFDAMSQHYPQQAVVQKDRN